MFRRVLSDEIKCDSGSRLAPVPGSHCSDFLRYGRPMRSGLRRFSGGGGFPAVFGSVFSLFPLRSYRGGRQGGEKMLAEGMICHGFSRFCNGKMPSDLKNPLLFSRNFAGKRHSGPLEAESLARVGVGVIRRLYPGEQFRAAQRCGLLRQCPRTGKKGRPHLPAGLRKAVGRRILRQAAGQPHHGDPAAPEYPRRLLSAAGSGNAVCSVLIRASGGRRRCRCCRRAGRRHRRICIGVRCRPRLRGLLPLFLPHGRTSFASSVAGRSLQDMRQRGQTDEPPACLKRKIKKEQKRDPFSLRARKAGASWKPQGFRFMPA